MSTPRLRRLLALARLGLWWEAAWPRLWGAAALAAAFVGLALLDVLPLLPAWLHLALLIAVGIAIIGIVVHAARTPWPSAAAAERRLERDSGAAHRPLGALDDRLAAGAGDPLALALWQRHRARMRAALPGLRLRPPAPGMARREPWGLRAAALLLLIIGLAASAGDAGGRLARALSPDAFAGAVLPAVEAWIRPPAYTALPPLLLRDQTGSEASPLAHGSTVIVRVGPLARAPRLLIGESEQPFTALGAADAGRGTFVAEATIEAGEAIEVRARGRTLARWPIRVVADAPPAAAWTAPPAALDASGRFRLAYDARDDYGVAALAARIRPAAGDSVADAAAGGELRIAIPIAADEAGGVAGSHDVDLAHHAWAGRPVTLILEATDGIGQIGRSAPALFVLPERTFHHPVARAVIDARRALLDAGNHARRQAAMALAAIAGHPERFDDDVVVALALAVARARLIHDQSADATASVRRILWQTALRIEEGEVPAARDALAAASRALADALRQDASAATLDRLLEAVRDALGRYLDALAAEMQRRGETAPLPAELARMLSATDLDALLDQTRRLIETGARDAASRLLDALQRLIAGTRAGPGAAQLREALRQERALIEALRGLTDDQQRLLDETFRRWGDAAQPGGPGRSGRDPGAAARQQALRERLAEIMRQAEGALGEAPAALGEADDAMGGAGEALGEGRAADALDAQGAAVEALRRGEGALGSAFARRRSGQPGLLLFGGGMAPGADPFGRTPGDGGSGFGLGDLDLPEAGALHRAQQIVEELRRRAGEAHRPRPELDYIERLLRLF